MKENDSIQGEEVSLNGPPQKKHFTVSIKILFSLSSIETQKLDDNKRPTDSQKQSKQRGSHTNTKHSEQVQQNKTKGKPRALNRSCKI